MVVINTKAKKIFLWILKNLMELIGATALVAAILITTVNAITRYTMRVTWNPGTDITTLSFAWVVFCGAAAAYKRKMHYGVELVINHLPPKARRIVNKLTNILLTFLIGYAFYLAIYLAGHCGAKIMTNTRISYFWYDLSAVVGFAFMFIYQLRDTYCVFRDDCMEEKA